MNATVFVSWDGDGIGQKVGRATLSDDVAEVKRVNQAIEQGNEIWRAWALAAGGSVVEIGGDEGRIEVPASVLSDLEAVRQQYGSRVGATVSVGVGMQLSQSAKALLAAKLRGKDRIVLYEPGVEDEIKAAQQPSEQEKITAEYLTKADRHDEGSGGPAHGGKHGHAAAKQAGRDHQDHEQGAEAVAAAGPQAPKAYEAHFRAAAATQARRDQAATMQQSQDFGALKHQVAAALQEVQTQLPVLTQLKGAYPDAFKAVLSLVQATIAFGRAVGDADEQLGAAAEGGQPLGKGEFWPIRRASKEELVPDEAVPEDGALDKEEPPPAHRRLTLPVGTQHHGEVKVMHSDGKTGWKGVRAGQIQGIERDAPLMGANSHPVSSREPGSK